MVGAWSPSFIAPFSTSSRHRTIRCCSLGKVDPLTAISLASNIISFIDFSWSLLTGAKELHDSRRKTTKENARIGAIVHDLKEYSLDLGAASVSAHHAKSRHEKALQALAAECHTLCKELLQVTKNSRWHALRKTWEALRRTDEISSIELRLDKCRAQMNARLLALLR